MLEKVFDSETPNFNFKIVVETKTRNEVREVNEWYNVRGIVKSLKSDLI